MTNTKPTIDIFIEPPIHFEDLWRDAVPMLLSGVTVRVASVAPAGVAALSIFQADCEPSAWGSWEDAEALRRWSFRRRTPERRLAWLVSTLELAYASGALTPRGARGFRGNARQASAPV